MSGAGDCIFCGIVAGTLPAQKAGATELSYAFFDLRPVAPTHVLVVPRAHVTDAAALGPDDGDVLADMFVLARHVAEAERLDGGYRLVFNVGEDSGNSVAHLHLHVLGGRRLAWPPG